MSVAKRSLYFPYDSNKQTEFINVSYKDKLESSEIEYLSISPTLTLMYNIVRYGPPNPHLIQYGGICVNVPGPAVLIGNDPVDGEDADVPEDILDNLEQILEDDMRKRNNFTQNIRSMFGDVEVVQI